MEITESENIDFAAYTKKKNTVCVFLNSSTPTFLIIQFYTAYYHVGLSFFFFFFSFLIYTFFDLGMKKIEQQLKAIEKEKEKRGRVMRKR